MDAPLRLGNYEPLFELAAGGMATVYIARQVGAGGFERIVVLKRVHRHLLGNREFTDMFRDEGRVASMIRHANVVAVNDVVESDNELFLVMDYVEGSTLATVRKTANEQKRVFEPRVVVRIVIDALAGLHAAHEARDMKGRQLEVVHRDISPQNIVLGVDGISRIIDFGVAKARHRLTETKSGSVKGKYGYMSPEQARGQPVDRRTDLFAIGTVMHEMLTGKRLFRGENELDTIRRIVEAPIEPPSKDNPLVPTALDAVVQRALERSPEQRFQTAPEFIEALERACPPASAREAAALLQEVCGPRIEERAEVIRSILEGRAPPLPDADREHLQSNGSGLSVAERSAGTEGKITVMQDATQPGRRSRLAPILAAAAALAAITVAIVVLATRGPSAESSTGKGAVSMASSVAQPSEAPKPSASVQVAPAEVTITLQAEATIESVSAQGTRRVELDGTTARLVVAPYQGDLKVEATLKGGKHVSANVASGAREAKLSVAGKGTPPTPSAAKTTTTIPTATGQELQSNPYGNQ